MNQLQPAHILKILFLFLLVLPQPSCRSLKTIGSREKLQTTLRQIQAEVGMPGISAAVALPNGKTIVATAGYSDTTARTPMLPPDRLMSGSTGKTFVAAIIARLVEMNKLSYDDKLEKWFGNEDFFSQIPNGEAITVRMLSSHRTGWVHHFFESKKFLQEFVQIITNTPERYFAPEELFPYVTYDEALFEAGTQFHYSDMNYIALGLIIEKITGRRYYQVLQDWILTPFKLTNTIPADKLELEGLINGYTNPRDPFFGRNPTSMQDGKLTFNPSIEWTGGGLATNPGDLARWAKILWGAEWLNKSTVEMLTQSYGSSPRHGIEGYGFGTIIWQTDLGELHGHSGFYPGYNTIMGYFPEKKIGVAIQINQDHGNGNLKEMLLRVARVVEG